MITLAILTIISILLIAFAIFAISVGGSAFVIMFGDIIVCVALIMLLIRFIWRRRH